MRLGLRQNGSHGNCVVGLHTTHSNGLADPSCHRCTYRLDVATHREHASDVRDVRRSRFVTTLRMYAHAQMTHGKNKKDGAGSGSNAAKSDHQNIPPLQRRTIQ